MSVIKKIQSRFAAHQERQGSFYTKINQHYHGGSLCLVRIVPFGIVSFSHEKYTSMWHFTSLSQCNSVQKTQKFSENLHVEIANLLTRTSDVDGLAIFGYKCM